MVAIAHSAVGYVSGRHPKVAAGGKRHQNPLRLRGPARARELLQLPQSVRDLSERERHTPHKSALAQRLCSATECVSICLLSHSLQHTLGGELVEKWRLAEQTLSAFAAEAGLEGGQQMTPALAVTA